MDSHNDRDRLRSSPHLGLNQNYLGHHADSDIDHSRSSILERLVPQFDDSECIHLLQSTSGGLMHMMGDSLIFLGRNLDAVNLDCVSLLCGATDGLGGTGSIDPFVKGLFSTKRLLQCLIRRKNAIKGMSAVKEWLGLDVEGGRGPSGGPLMSSSPCVVGGFRAILDMLFGTQGLLRTSRLKQARNGKAEKTTELTNQMRQLVGWTERQKRLLKDQPQ